MPYTHRGYTRGATKEKKLNYTKKQPVQEPPNLNLSYKKNYIMNNLPADWCPWPLVRDLMNVSFNFWSKSSSCLKVQLFCSLQTHQNKQRRANLQAFLLSIPCNFHPIRTKELLDLLWEKTNAFWRLPMENPIADWFYCNK